MHSDLLHTDTTRSIFEIYVVETPIVTSGVIVMIAILILPFMQLGIYGLYRLRLRIWRNLYDSDSATFVPIDAHPADSYRITTTDKV